MAHAYTNILIHALFSTKGRRPLLDKEVRNEIFRYLGGTINALGGQSLLVNGVADHVHLLFALPPTLALSDLMEKMKAHSSGWVKRPWPERGTFDWQRGYAAFSVSKSQVERVKRYIENQEEHHRKLSFDQELVELLTKHGIQYDARYLSG